MEEKESEKGKTFSYFDLLEKRQKASSPVYLTGK